MLPGEMMIIGGETGAGKSMLLNNIAIQMWMQKNTVFTEDYMKGCNVLYFSLEMPFEACFRRTMARVADVPMYGIRDASLYKSQLEAMNTSFDFIDKYPYQFEIVDIPRGVTVDQIEARFLEAKAKFNPDVVVVDYLGLLEDSDSEGDDWLKLGHIAGKLHELARYYNIVVLTAVQLNRPTTKVNKDSSDLIGIHRIGRSSLIMHHANIGIQIESRKDESTYGDLKYHVIKNRDGETGCHSLVKNFKHASLKDPEVPFEPPRDDSGILPLDGISEDISTLLEKYKWSQS
jgi:replicative DNA helicase